MFDTITAIASLRQEGSEGGSKFLGDIGDLSWGALSGQMEFSTSKGKAKPGCWILPGCTSAPLVH